MTAHIFATISTFVGKLQYADPQTGLPQVGGHMQTAEQPGSWQRAACLVLCGAVRCGLLRLGPSGGDACRLVPPACLPGLAWPAVGHGDAC